MARAGAFRHRLTISPVTTGRGAMGGTTAPIGAGNTVWGSFAPVDSRERFDQNQFQVRPTHRAEIRYRADVAVRSVLTYQSRIFDVVGLSDPSERQDGQTLELLCVARRPGAVL